VWTTERSSSISDDSSAASKCGIAYNNFTGMPKYQVTLQVQNTQVEILFVVKN